MKLVFAVLAIVFFLMAAFKVADPRVNWIPVGYACVTAAVFLPL